MKKVRVTVYGRFQITREYKVSDDWENEDLLQRLRDDEFHQNFPLEETDWEFKEVEC